MKKIILVLFLAVIFSSKLSFAHAPSNLELEYDFEKQVLKIKIIHITQDLQKHYIRVIKIQKNEEKPEVLFFHWQKDNKLIEQEINIEAEVGDVFKVKANCKQGGVRRVEFIVEEPVEEQEEKAVEEAQMLDESVQEAEEAEAAEKKRELLEKKGSEY